MKIKVCFLAALLSSATLYAQNQTQTPTPQSSTSVKQDLKPRAYVRRFSMGAALSVLALPTVPNRTTSNIVANPALDAIYTTTGTFDLWHRIGYGATAQLSVTERFAVNIGLFVHKVQYQMNSDVFEGTDNPTTLVDERRHTVRNEDTRAKFYDLPVLVRYYGKDRHKPGPRWFLEGGGAVRRVSNIKSSIDTTIGTAATVCCDTAPIKPFKRTAPGAVAGLGFQLIDDFGIRIVPEVRYTRWFDQAFNSFSTGTQRNQIEAMISLTF